jgi:hypothetical protein
LQTNSSYLSSSEVAELDRQLQPWMQPTSKGRVRVAQGNPQAPFIIKCVGVFDTVGRVHDVICFCSKLTSNSSFGLPEELAIVSKTMRQVFGFKFGGV